MWKIINQNKKNAIVMDICVYIRTIVLLGARIPNVLSAPNRYIFHGCPNTLSVGHLCMVHT